MITLEDCTIIHKQTVSWGDMDALGHVNNVIYYRYIESARITYFEALNLFDYDISIVISKSSCNYLSSVIYPDTLLIAPRVEEIRKSALRMSYTLFSKQQNKIVATGEAVMVCLDKSTHQKTTIPDTLKTAILNLEAKTQHQPILI